MQFAYRQRLFYSGWRLLLVGTPLGLLLGFAGPFGTYPAFPAATRYTFWTALTIVGVAAALVANTSLPIDKPANRFVRIGVVACLSAIPMTFVVAWTMTLIQPNRTYSPQQLFALFWGVAAVQLLIVFVNAMANPKVAGKSLSVPQALVGRHEPVSYPQALLSRLPTGMRSEIIALETQDHYLRVHTKDGTSLILMRMADAVALLHPELGLQVHRRWWVAEAAVVEMETKRQKMLLRLTDDSLVPIGRTFATAARARFGLCGKSEK